MKIIIENETAGIVWIEDRTKPGTLLKQFSMDELGALLPKAVVKQPKKQPVWVNADFGLIPLNCIWYQSRVKEDQVMHRAIFFVPSGRRIINYKEVDHHVFIPNLVFKFTVLNGHISEPMVAVVKDHEIPSDFLYGIRSFCPKETAQLCQWPFSNVGPSGHICMGGKNFGKTECLNDLVNVPEMFISSIMTDHSYSSANSSGLEYTQYLQYLSGLESFDEKGLKPMKERFGDWIK